LYRNFKKDFNKLKKNVEKVIKHVLQKKSYKIENIDLDKKFVKKLTKTMHKK